MKLSSSVISGVSALTLAAALAGCSGGIGGEEASSDQATLKIGFVSTTRARWLRSGRPTRSSWTR